MITKVSYNAYASNATNMQTKTKNQKINFGILADERTAELLCSTICDLVSAARRGNPTVDMLNLGNAKRTIAKILENQERVDLTAVARYLMKSAEETDRVAQEMTSSSK